MTRWLATATVLGALACGDDDGLDGAVDAALEYESVDGGPAWRTGDAAFPPPSTAPIDAALHVLDAAPGLDASETVPPDAGDADPTTPPPDAGDDSGATNCHRLQPGQTLRFEDALTADAPSWQRIDAMDGCPAAVLSAVDVHYRSYVLCPAAEPLVLDITMRGADMLDATPPSPLFDPMLAVYADETALRTMPFDCLAANDDGQFDGKRSNSARIEGFQLEAGTPVVVIATSHEPAAQHGVGRYDLSVAVQ